MEINGGMELEDEDLEALSELSSTVSAVPRKVYSYSQQLRGPSSPSTSQRRYQGRKHSLDDIAFSLNANTGVPVTSNRHFQRKVSDDEDDDEDFFSRASSGDFLAVSDDLIKEYHPLPEFIANGGNAPPFKAPMRAAVHPGRPPCLELRPHPLRETQVGKFLRIIACTGEQLWAGQECGIRMWDLQHAYDTGHKMGSGKVKRGDEDAAPFHESSNTSPAMCLLVDEANKLVWSGHKDGKIRTWKTDQTLDSDKNVLIKEGLSWQAHKGPVLAMVISSQGDLWSGGEGGVIKIWQWDSLGKSLNLSSGEKRMAALLVERSAIDLRSQVTVNGTCNLSSSDLKCMVSDYVKAKIWCGQSQSFSLWDARTKELLKVFNIDGHIENRADMSSTQQQDQPAEDEIKVKFVSSSKKEKSQGFLQRSRNAIIGAADAVRRVATRGAGAFAEETKRTEALVATPDGMIWSGCSNGLLVQWDGNGNRIQDISHHTSTVQCFCSLADRIYVGYASGIIKILDLDGNIVASWVAHSNPVLQMAAGNGFLFTLACHGGIRAWSVTSPGPADSIIRSGLAVKEEAYAKQDSLRVLVGTWNVGQGKPVHDALMSWLGSTSSDVGIVVVGLQEVDMGAGFLAMSAAKETVGLEGSALGQLWVDAIGKALEEGITFERMGSRQLAGLLISLWVRKSLRTHVGDVDAGAVPCGFGRAIGNKGGVGLRIRVLDRIMCFVNCHLAAHLEAVNRRNADFDHIFRNMAFTRSSAIASSAGGSATVATVKAANPSSSSSDEPKMDLAEADMVVFLGDFNYRLFGMTYDEARDFVSQRCFDWLREKDQLRAEMKAGKVFQGMREAVITFPPTYKFERHHPGLAGYDSGEKKRIPAWCDRVIYRDNRGTPTGECSLECPVVSSILQYEACMDVTESDHKPVRCKFHIKVAHVDRSVRREGFGEIIKSEEVQSLLQDLSYVPDVFVSTTKIVLQNQDRYILRITNRSQKEKVTFRILCQGQSTVKNDGDKVEFLPRGSYGFPSWLEVNPSGGVVEPNNFVEISVRNEEFHTLEELVDGIPQNWWSEDTRDKEVILHVNVQRSCSTETRSYPIHVRHYLSAKPIHSLSHKN